MDVLIHLSYREGLPRALPQAMAAGRPVVAYDCDGAGEVCRTGETGFLIKPGNLDELIDAVFRLASSQELRRNLGENGRRLVLHEFTTDQLVERQYVLYQRLLSQLPGERLSSR